MQERSRILPENSEISAAKQTSKYVKRVISRVKSPSDTTIYALALNLMPEKVGDNQAMDKVMDQSQNIVRYVENIRLETVNSLPVISEEGAVIEDVSMDVQLQLGLTANRHDEARDTEHQRQRRAQEEANHHVVEAEQMKAKLDVP